MNSHRVGRRLTALAAACPFVVLAFVPLAAGAKYKSSGTFVLSGAVSGKLVVPKSLNRGGLPGCAISGISGTASAEGGTDTINWDNVKLVVGGKSQVVPFVSLAIDTSRFGKTFSIDEAASTHTGVSLLAGSSYSSTSGSATTAKDGVSGSLNGVLKGASGGPAVKLKGRWAGCAAVHA